MRVGLPSILAKLHPLVTSTLTHIVREMFLPRQLKRKRELSSTSAEDLEDGSKRRCIPIEIENPTATSAIPYTIFSKSKKRLITTLIGISMFFSPFSANIYLPCIDALQHTVHTTPELINLTITVYVVIQGVAPAFFGDLADTIGRRPVYLITFSIYVAANVGLAVQNSYAALMMLRALQSFGCSATIAIGYGVVADVATPAERGSMLGLASVAMNLGPSLGPLAGGLLAARAGWRWVFWLLVIFGASFLAILLMFFPETARNVVSNGSVPPKGWNRTLISKIRPPRDCTQPITDQTTDPTQRRKITFPNPLKSLRVIFHRDTGAVLSISAIYYATYYTIQASLPSIFIDIYALNELEIGLCYFAIGIGVVLGGYLNGMLG